MENVGMVYFGMDCDEGFIFFICLSLRGYYIMGSERKAKGKQTDKVNKEKGGGKGERRGDIYGRTWED
jgi:hypothetical protein